MSASSAGRPSTTRVERTHPAIARRRSRVRRRRRSLVSARMAGAALCIGVGYWLATGPLLTVTNAQLMGYTGPHTSAVQEAVNSAAERGGSLLVPPVGAIRTAAQSDPWVHDVVVHRNWPLGLSVEVIPSRPVAVGNTPDGSQVLLSPDGRSMGPVTVQHKVPAKVAVTSPRTLAYGASVGARDRAVIAFVRALDPAVASRVTTIGIRHGVVVGDLRNGPQIRAGTPDRMAQKARVLSAVLAQVPLAEQQQARYLDVSVPDHPALGGPDADPRITRAKTSRTTLDPASTTSGDADTNAAAATGDPAVSTTDAGNG